MRDVERFEQECSEEIARQGKDEGLQKLTREWFDAANARKYSYHFKALGLPIIQYPQDIVAIQELIWSIKPTLVVETGIARGGSVVWSAAMLGLLDYAEAVQGTGQLDVRASARRVIGIDIDIRSHNRERLEAHPFAHKLNLIQGSSIDPEIVKRVRDTVRPDDRVMVILDSNHTHDHVLRELEAYAPLVSPGSYCIVFDTVIEDLPDDGFADRPWKVGDNPKTAVRAYLKQLAEGAGQAADTQPLRFELDTSFDDKLLITVAPEGFLRRLPV